MNLSYIQKHGDVIWFPLFTPSAKVKTTVIDRNVSKGIKPLWHSVVVKKKNVEGSTLRPLTPSNSIYRVFQENNHASYLFVVLFVETILTIALVFLLYK